MGALCLAAMPANPAASAEVEAYTGRPFGVGRITVPVTSDAPVVPLEDERFTVSSADGRVLYPVLKEEAVRRLLRRLLEIESPRFATMYFLFRGEEPFDVDAFSPARQSVRVTPQFAPQERQRLLDEWWREYGNRWKSLRQDPQFPPVVENFLASNLSRQSGLKLPEPSSGLFAALAPKKTVWDELLNTESHALAIDQSLLEPSDTAAQQMQPPPPPMPWYALPSAGEELNGVAVEPIALHVPAEAFYLRFGNFSNYLWFRHLNRKWQGDLGNMIVRRGIERAATERIEQQLSLKESALAKFLGPQVIEDVAFIGLDPYLNQGAAFGILFQAKSNPLLAQDLVGQRRLALKKFPDAAETTVRIAERDVSLIATPGGEVRSYYIQDGDFHLVATSRRLVQRFLLAGQGEQPLAASAGFLGMRKRLPVERSDAVFAYVSPEFFRELTSPAIWIESQRRARSAREAKILQLARLQAAAEGVAAVTRDELIAADFLAEGFGARADGSALVEHVEASAVDSVRGQPGLYLPVSEVEVIAVTAQEAAAYRAFTERFRQEVGQTPPVAVAIQRTPLADGTGETMAIDVLVTPLDDVKLGRLPDALGEPSDQRLAPVEGDLIHAEFVLDAVLPIGPAEPHHLFLGVRDFRAPLVVERGRLVAGAPPAELVRMYVGTWPKPGIVRLFLGEAPAEGPEPAPGPRETWQAKRDDFLLISFKPQVVEEVLPQLRMQPAAQPAQAWIDVADLVGAELSRAVNALGYMRSRETSVAACRLMNTLANQLHVPRESCREVAERLMDGRFVCPLGGEYGLFEVPENLPVWTSSALGPENRFLLTEPPADFELPLLSWFKGLRAEARLVEDEISAHVEIDMAASAVP